jgi:hypothetical protein
MGLIYSPGESGALSSAMASNIAMGQAIVAGLNSACNQLTSALSGGTLSGAAYTAGKGLFTDLVIPSVSKVSAALGNLSSELSQYNAAAGAAGGEYLNEDKLKEQLKILKKRKKDLEDRIEEYDRKMMTTPDASLCMMYARFQQQLMEYLRIVKEDIEKIKKKLEKLYAFDGAVSGLFGNSLSALQLAAQSVTILSAMTVDSSTGKFKFPKGTDKSWFTELQNSKADKKLLEKLNEPEPKIEIRWTPMNGAGQQYARVYVNGKLDAEKTKVLGIAMLKMGWKSFQKFAPDLVKALLSIDDMETLADPNSTVVESTISALSLLITFFPYARAAKIYKTMKGFKLLEKGITTTADLEKVSKAVGLTAKEAQALSDMWKLEGLAGYVDEVKTPTKVVSTAKRFDEVAIENYMKQVGKDFTQKDVEQLAKLTTHNADSPVALLGKYEAGSVKSYEQIGYANSASYFDAGNSGWKAMADINPALAQRVNDEFLRQQINQGKNFVLTSNPDEALEIGRAALLKGEKVPAYSAEIKLLKQSGYKWEKGIDGFWRANK